MDVGKKHGFPPEAACRSKVVPFQPTFDPNPPHNGPQKRLAHLGDFQCSRFTFSLFHYIIPPSSSQECQRWLGTASGRPAKASQGPRFPIFAISTPKSGVWMLGAAPRPQASACLAVVQALPCKSHAAGCFPGLKSISERPKS